MPGKEFPRDARLRTVEAADIAGLRGVVVDAKDEPAKQFDHNFHFEPFEGNPLRLSLILKDIRPLLWN